MARPIDRGRDKFEKYITIINVISLIIKLIPNNFKKLMWSGIQGWNGIIGIGLRYCILKSVTRNCGKNVLIGPFVEIRYWENLSIGDNVSIHRGCYIDSSGGVEIGNDVSIAHNSSILSFDHTWNNSEIPIKDNIIKLKKVVILNDVWVGCGCRILSGVTINNRSVVAAGAVVTKDIESGSLVGGIPAKVIKSIANEKSR